MWTLLRSGSQYFVIAAVTTALYLCAWHLPLEVEHQAARAHRERVEHYRAAEPLLTRHHEALEQQLLDLNASADVDEPVSADTTVSVPELMAGLGRVSKLAGVQLDSFIPGSTEAWASGHTQSFRIEWSGPPDQLLTAWQSFTRHWPAAQVLTSDLAAAPVDSRQMTSLRLEFRLFSPHRETLPATIDLPDEGLAHPDRQNPTSLSHRADDILH